MTSIPWRILVNREMGKLGKPGKLGELGEQRELCRDVLVERLEAGGDIDKKMI